ncbi:MAG TPA: HD domain-containing protein [Patescibacteria group bacterium]|nr:HD domain-containing protein [Patescibacteria group bacterium]
MITLPQSAKFIIDTLKTAGFEAFAVGGSVRDLLMGLETLGWDFTTNATPEQILELFPDSFYDNQFGTVGVKIREPASAKASAGEAEVTDIYEITTYRSEEGYKDHRHPDKISWGKTIDEDLARRDFTINAIAFDGKALVDPYNGQKDIKEKLIRAVRDPDERFAEDALRMLRAVRFAASFGFTIEEHTTHAVKNHASELINISAERIRDEFFKILIAPHAADAVLVLKNLGLLHFILPELEVAFATPQKSPLRHHIYDVGTHSVMAMKHCPSDDPIVRLATLIHDLGKVKTFRQDATGLITFYNHEVVSARIAKDVAKRMRLSRKDTETLYTLVRWHQFSVDERQTDSALRRFIRRVGVERLSKILALRIGDRLGGGATETSWRLELYKQRLVEVQKQPFTVTDLNVDGHDVMKILGVSPSPAIGKALDTLFAQVEAGTLPNEREALLKHLEELKGN